MTDTARDDTVWQAAGLAGAYLDGVRGAIPLANVQIDVLTRLARAAWTDSPGRRAGDAPAILDLGCGDGILGHTLLEEFGGRRSGGRPTVVLADFSSPMLEAARARFRRDVPAERLYFVEVDYARPDWPALVSGSGLPARYDIIVSGFSIHHQPDERKRRVYADIFDLLTPGGIFLNLEHVASASRWGEAQFEVHFIDALYQYHAPSGRTRDEVAADFCYRPDKSANILAPVELQCAWLREIGFADVDCFLKLFELALFGGRRPPADDRPRTTDNGGQTAIRRP